MSTGQLNSKSQHGSHWFDTFEYTPLFAHDATRDVSLLLLLRVVAHHSVSSERSSQPRGCGADDSEGDEG